MSKPKHKQRALPVPARPSTNAVDLYLLAGFPKPLLARVEEYLQTLAGADSKAIATAFPSYDGALYQQKSVQTLFTAGARFAIRRLKNRSDDQTARPRRVALFYVPSDDDEPLIRAFDFFVFPVAMRDLSTYDERGTQRRHLRHECESAIRKAMETYRRILVGSLQGRIESRKSQEPLLLPPVNFHLPGERLTRAFCELARGTRTWENSMPDTIVSETFDHERLPGFLRPQEHQVIFKDARGVVYPCSRATEMHGVQGIDADADESNLREMLRSTYRFGTSLPQGFHHDAQFEYGRHFDNTQFDCSRKGSCLVSGSHANVYPNDFVNPAE
jgi:hypothetical protein